MAASGGKNILIKDDSDGAGNFITLGGMRTKALTINRESIDVTDSDSVQLFRELLEGGGVASLSLSGGGVFKASAGEKRCVGRVIAGTIVEHQFVYPGLGTFEGLFQTTQAQLNGEYNGEAQFQLSFESAGVIAFTAE